MLISDLVISKLCLQVNGHYMAKLDPLGLDERKMPIELDPALYGFTDKDLDRECAPSAHSQYALCKSLT